MIGITILAISLIVIYAALTLTFSIGLIKHLICLEWDDKVLCRLRPDGVVQQLQELAGGKDKDIALICYENPGEFCHRNIVREWLKEFGYEVEEYIFLKDALKKLLEEPPMYVGETLMAFDKPGETK